MISKLKFWLGKRSLALPLAALMLIVSGATGTVALAHADTGTTTAVPAQGAQSNRPRPAAIGTVTAVNGSIFTVQTRAGKNMATTTYAVDASNATITKVAAPAAKGDKPTSTTITASQVAVGDLLSVQGTTSGTNITATSITDGMGFGGFGAGRGPGAGMGAAGSRGVRGTVSAVNGSTVTVTGQDGKTYTVDASNATATKIETITPSDISVGDSVTVGGSVSGTNVTAKTIVDGMLPMPMRRAASTTPAQ